MLPALNKTGLAWTADAGSSGTGDSAIAYLRELPVDILKIDRTFATDPDSEALVKLIIDTGHHLGAIVTAEGIETAEQAGTLAALGSDVLQGFYYGLPCPEAELPRAAKTKDRDEEVGSGAKAT